MVPDSAPALVPSLTSLKDGLWSGCVNQTKALLATWPWVVVLITRTGVKLENCCFLNVKDAVLRPTRTKWKSLISTRCFLILNLFCSLHKYEK